MLPFKQNEEWILWQHTVELQCKANKYFCVIYLKLNTKTLTTGNDKELWDQQLDNVNLLFNNHIKTTMGKMICDDDLVLNRPHLIWQNIVAFYKDSSLVHSNASLIWYWSYCIMNQSVQHAHEFFGKVFWRNYITTMLIPRKRWHRQRVLTYKYGDFRGQDDEE